MAAPRIYEPNIAFTSFDTNWHQLPVDDPASTLLRNELCDDVEELAVVESILAKKTEHFMSLEADARSFMSQLGFDNLPPILVVKEAKQLRKLGMESSPPTIATVGWLNQYLLVRGQLLDEYAAGMGDTKAASILVHELMHSTQERVAIGARFLDSRKVDLWTRAGFIYGGKNKVRGHFIEEALGVFVGGLYVRSKTNQAQGLISFTTEPEPSVPDYYNIRGRAENGFLETTLGVDGYVLEMIMWRLEQNDTMSSEDFFANMLMSRSTTTQAIAMRSLIRAFNSLKPKLYDQLSAVQYGRDHWRDMGRYVYGLVTGKPWSEQF